MKKRALVFTASIVVSLLFAVCGGGDKADGVIDPGAYVCEDGSTLAAFTDCAEYLSYLIEKCCARWYGESAGTCQEDFKSGFATFCTVKNATIINETCKTTLETLTQEKTCE